MALSTAERPVVPLYAGFWRRAAALLVDELILFAGGIVVGFAVGIALRPAPAAGFMIGTLIGLALGLAYYTAFHGSPKQATPGKMALGVKVTTRDGNRISYLRAAARYFARWISSLLLMVGYLFAAFTGRKQALHDMIAGTLVVNAKADPAEVAAGGGTMPITAGVVAAIVILGALPVIASIGIMAAIAIPAYQDYTVRVKVAEVLHVTALLRDDVREAHSKKEPFKVGPQLSLSRYAQGVEVTPNGEIAITFAPEVGGGGSIVYTPNTDEAGAVTWKCASRGMPEKYLPAICRGNSLRP
jgi:uncharacterized RDD family membrane protein YckC/Tfp pilus assembly major pilin PilA